MNLEINHIKHLEQMLLDSRQVILTTHMGADGDDAGAVFGLYHCLRLKGIRPILAIQGAIPSQLLFLPQSNIVRDSMPEDLETQDCIVVAGCSEASRTGFDITTNQARIINIDHHPDNTFYGKVNIVDSSASSVAEIVYRLIKILKWELPPTAAECFLVGIISDTGGFRFSNTTPGAMQAISDLIRLGARPKKAFDQLTTWRPDNTQQTWAFALKSANFNQYLQCVTVAIPKDSPEIDTEGAYDGVTDFLNKTRNNHFTLLARQKHGVVKVSLRSSPNQKTDVGSLARAFKGGGHKYAAGFTLPGDLKKTPTSGWRIE